MEIKKKYRVVSLKLFIFAFLVIGISYGIIAAFTIKNRIDETYQQLEQESIKIAQSYSHSLINSSNAQNMIHELLSDKLAVAGKAASLYDGEINNDSLHGLAELLEIDAFYVYNTDGVIEYSNTGDYINWKAKPGHPVYDFIMSNETFFIEDIRKDSESDIYYKYGYFRNADGSIVQIGIFAESINELLYQFKIDSLLGELQEDAFIEQLFFIDNQNTIIAGTNKIRIGEKITDSVIKDYINKNKNYTQIDKWDGTEIFQGYVPVYVNGEKMGTLVVGQSTEVIGAVISDIFWNGIYILIIELITLGILLGISYRKSKKYLKLAYYDSLSGLPNKEYMNEILIDKINNSLIVKKAILLFNYYNFNQINLSYGYDYGHQIIKKITENLTILNNHKTSLFHLSTERFVLYIEDYAEQELIMMIDQLNQISQSVSSTSTYRAYLGIKVGIVEFHNNYRNVDQLIKDASIALNYIENKEGLDYIFFNDAMQEQLKHESIIVQELQEALKKETSEVIYVEFQPQVDLRTNRIVAFEALARMKSKQLGEISPVEFIAVAEKNHLINRLGNYVLKTACRFIKNENIKVSVNISGIQILNNDFIKILMDIISETNINSSFLEIEITESILLDNYDIINDKLKILQEMGIKIAIDDFGTGYSSFARLIDLNVDIVKIDRFFINRILSKSEKSLILSDIISMAHKIGLTVVAEGVEKTKQKQYLIEHHCDIMQGYLFSKPLKEEKANELLTKQNMRDNKNVEN